MTESNASAVPVPAAATLSYEAEVTAAASKVPGGRLVSLDAFRGFIMRMLISSAFGLVSLQNDSTFIWLGRQFDHVEWTGMVFWDLIQPFYGGAGDALLHSAAAPPRERASASSFATPCGDPSCCGSSAKS